MIECRTERPRSKSGASPRATTAVLGSRMVKGWVGGGGGVPRCSAGGSRSAGGRGDVVGMSWRGHGEMLVGRAHLAAELVVQPVDERRLVGQPELLVRGSGLGVRVRAGNRVRVGARASWGSRSSCTADQGASG